MKKLTLLTMTLCLSIAIVQTAFAGPGIGSAAPDFGLYDVDGNIHYLSDYEGQVVVLNFWASW